MVDKSNYGHEVAVIFPSFRLVFRSFTARVNHVQYTPVHLMKPAHGVHMASGGTNLFRK